MRGSLALLALLAGLGSPLAARADGPHCPPHATSTEAPTTAPADCLDHTPALVLRLHAGLGVFLNGGAVTLGLTPDLLEHARLSTQLAVEVGARPFGGGFVISLILAGQAASRTFVGTFGLSLEYDIFYLGDPSPNRDVALAVGGALAMDYAHSATLSAAGVVSPYDLLRPDWRGYLELRIRTGQRERALIRAQVVTGFDDLLDLASLTVCGGYVFEAF